MDNEGLVGIIEPFKCKNLGGSIATGGTPMLCRIVGHFYFKDLVGVAAMHFFQFVLNVSYKNLNETLGEAGLNDLLLSYLGVIRKISTIHCI